jgi:transglutaminase-like putative cysteine protease
MIFSVSSSLSYNVITTTTFFFNIMASKSSSQRIIEESLVLSPAIAFEEFSTDNSNARFIKLEAQKGTSFTISYKAKVEVQFSRIKEEDLLSTIPFMQMDHEVLQYIAPSRHCESDKLMEFALHKFGDLPNAYAKALAIEDWIFNNVKYSTGSTNSSASATDTVMRGVGACKDAAHLGIALCRALDIPARYFSSYACHLTPPDIHACFEAYINGHWIIFDPTKLAPLNGLVKISNGKDASEAPIASYFGEIYCTKMDVRCTALLDEFVPFNWENRRVEAISY